MSNFFGSLGCGINDDPTVDNKEDAQRRPPLGAAVRLAREMEDGDINRRSLARAGRQIEEGRPSTRLNHMPGKTCLPREWILTMD
jgi:hypothetical protein